MTNDLKVRKRIAVSSGIGFTSIEIGDISYDEVKDYYNGQVELVIRDDTQQ